MVLARVEAFDRAGDVVAYVLIDAVDLPRCQDRLVRLHRGGYATIGRSFLHRLVTGCARGDGREVDHRNHDRLDCRRANLRVGTRALNAQNFPVCAGSSSRFRGVGWYAPRGYWQAYVQAGGRLRKIGYSRDELEAAWMAHLARCEAMPWALPDPELVAELERRGDVRVSQITARAAV